MKAFLDYLGELDIYVKNYTCEFDPRNRDLIYIESKTRTYRIHDCFVLDKKDNYKLVYYRDVRLIFNIPKNFRFV